MSEQQFKPGDVVEYKGVARVVDCDFANSDVLCLDDFDGNSPDFEPDWSACTRIPVPEGFEPSDGTVKHGPAMWRVKDPASSMHDWRFGEDCAPDSDQDIIWLRRKPVEQQFSNMVSTPDLRGAMTAMMDEVSRLQRNGDYALIRPAPEVSEAKFDPRALRKGDAVTFPGQTGAFRYIVDRFDGSRMWRGHGGMCAFEALHHAAHVNGTPIADWVRDVQPGRLAEAQVTVLVPQTGVNVVNLPPPVPGFWDVAPGAPEAFKRVLEAPTCAACSRPITGRPLELDEGAVKLCPGDAREWKACVNAYARQHAPKRYDPDAEREACRMRIESAGALGLTMDIIQSNQRERAERAAMHAQASDAAAANEWHRGVGMCGPWVKR